MKINLDIYFLTECNFLFCFLFLIDFLALLLTSQHILEIMYHVFILVYLKFYVFKKKVWSETISLLQKESSFQKPSCNQAS